MFQWECARKRRIDWSSFSKWSWHFANSSVCEQSDWNAMESLPGWLGSGVVSALDSGAVHPSCVCSPSIEGCGGNCRPGLFRTVRPIDCCSDSSQSTRIRSMETGLYVWLNSVPLATWCKKGKVFPYSLPSVGPGADPGVQAVSPQVTWSESRHIHSSSLPLLSARPAFTFVAFTRWRNL